MGRPFFTRNLHASFFIVIVYFHVLISIPFNGAETAFYVHKVTNSLTHSSTPEPLHMLEIVASHLIWHILVS